jgi:hypothetical protein
MSGFIKRLIGETSSPSVLLRGCLNQLRPFSSLLEDMKIEIEGLNCLESQKGL